MTGMGGEGAAPAGAIAAMAPGGSTYDGLVTGFPKDATILTSSWEMIFKEGTKSTRDSVSTIVKQNCLCPETVEAIHNFNAGRLQPPYALYRHHQTSQKRGSMSRSDHNE